MRARLPTFAALALAALPADRDVPWHRVVNARGEISPRGRPLAESEQRLLLEGEQVALVVQHAGGEGLRRAVAVAGAVERPREDHRRAGLVAPPQRLVALAGEPLEGGDDQARTERRQPVVPETLAKSRNVMSLPSASYLAPWQGQ